MGKNRFMYAVNLLKLVYNQSVSILHANSLFAVDPRARGYIISLSFGSRYLLARIRKSESVFVCDLRYYL